MTIKDLRTLIKANFTRDPNINFSDVQTATRNAIIEYFGLEGISPRELREKRPMIMALIEEYLDEALPKGLESRIGDFAEIKQFARDAEVVFKVENRGKKRAYLTIKKGSRGGVYQAARLDSTYLTVDTYVETVGLFVTLEEILLGRYSLVDLMDNILDGFVEKLYVQVIEALQAAGGNAPAPNRGSGSGVDVEELDKIIRVISAYGSPMIVGFRSVISKIFNTVGATNVFSPNIPTSDLEEVKKRGFVANYKGNVPIVELPNYIVDENTNAEWLLDEKYLFILPTNSKPVKVALKGEMYSKVIEHPSGSEEQNMHKILGVAVLVNNNIGLYTDTDIS